MSRVAATALGLVVAWAGHCADFKDPTRPPGAIDSPAAGAVAEDGSSTGPRLESVLIAPDRRIAVISGQQVRLGGKVGEGKVVRITESEVVISSASGSETLKLLPDAVKQSRTPRERRKSK